MRRIPIFSLQFLFISLSFIVVSYKTVFPEHLPTRTINIKIAVDSEFANMEEWPAEIKKNGEGFLREF